MDRSRITGEATVTVAASPDVVLDLVLDLERYRQADHKIGRGGTVTRSGDEGTARFSGRLRGVPGPAGTYPFTVSETRLRFGPPIAGAARWVLQDFEATFDCRPGPQGTMVTHREMFRFRAPWRWLANPLLRRWLRADVAAEMERFKALADVDRSLPDRSPDLQDQTR